MNIEDFISPPHAPIDEEELAQIEEILEELPDEEEEPETLGGLGSGRYPKGSGKIFYHGTSNTRLDKILHEGLKSQHAGEVVTDAQYGHVYITNSFEDAKLWAAVAASKLASEVKRPRGSFFTTPTRHAAILRIEVPADEVAKLVPDENMLYGAEEIPELFQFHGNIPPEWIKGVTKGRLPNGVNLANIQRGQPDQVDWYEETRVRRRAPKILEAGRTIWAVVLYEEELETLGGPGSGRYPKGSGEDIVDEEATYKLQNKLFKLSPAREHPVAMNQLHNDPDAARILADGVLTKITKQNRMELLGTDGRCHWNTAELFESGVIDAIVIGYAKNSAVGWHQHTWGEKNGKIIETTQGNMSSTFYYGVTLDKKESAAFAKWAIENDKTGKVRYGNHS